MHPYLKEVHHTIFPIAFAYYMAFCQILVILAMFQTFSWLWWYVNSGLLCYYHNSLKTQTIALVKQFCYLVATSCLTLCNHMGCSTPASTVYHQLLELAQTHVHRVSDAIQPSHPLSSSSPAFNLSQHQGLFQWVSSSHQVVKVLGASASTSVLPMNIQDWFPLGLTGWISWQSKGLSRVFSNTVQKYQFFGAQLSLWSNSHIHTWLLEKL